MISDALAQLNREHITAIALHELKLMGSPAQLR